MFSLCFLSSVRTVMVGALTGLVISWEALASLGLASGGGLLDVALLGPDNCYLARS